MAPGRGRATLQLPSPWEVTRALAGIGRYRFGIPDAGLRVDSWFGGTDAPYLAASLPLVEGDVYVDSIDNWLLWLGGQDPPIDGVESLVRRLQSLPRWLRLLTLLHFVPVKIRVPRLGGPVTFSPHGKIVLMGEFGAAAGSPVETWSASMSYDVVGPDIGAMPDTIGPTALAAVASAWSTVIAATSGKVFGGGIFLTEVAYYRAKADGKSTTGTWERFFLTTPAEGTDFTGPANWPLQVAVAVSLDAGGARGGRFGRFFLPAPAMSLTHGVMAESDAANLLSSVKTALTAVNTALSAVVTGDVELVVASGRGSGENRPVRTLRVGRVPDTIRSRRRDLDEAYEVTPFQSV